MLLFGIMVNLILLVVMFAIIFKANRSVQGSRAQNVSSEDLKSFGYKQELLRDMGGFSNFAVSFSIISILTGAVTLYGYGFNQGGPAIMGVGWPLVTLFVLFIAAAMAELTSSIPTSGAIYHWASILGGPRWGWFTGWLNIIGQVTIVAGIDFGCAGFASALLFGNPTHAQTLITYAVILVMHATFNHIGINVVSKLNSFSAIYHFIGVFIIIGVLTAFGPHHNVGYLFNANFSTMTSGSTPYWFAFLVGLLQAQWTLTGYDASAHTSEETIDPKVRAPWGVYLSVAISGIFGFILLAIVTMSIKDPAAVAQAGNNAFIVAIQQAVGGWFGQAMLWMITIAMWFCGLSSITSSSRMVFAFSRDKGLPLSHLWAHVSKKFYTPNYAIWLITLIAFLAAIFNNVYAVITSLSVIGLYGSYFIPIFLKLRAKFKGVWTAKDDGPWNLKNWSNPVSVIACVWIIFLVILMTISPSDVAITGSYTLHYATGKIFISVLVLLTIYFFTYAKNRFEGPHLGSYAEISKRLQKKDEDLAITGDPVQH
ncbi:amino acid permease [Sporolactobacillus spathodeae]|uniref:Amino acid transporter n=1 Tax=Sporolactobacillus spathodeae TaxID=1465502 RepID=A0ABS2Q9L2_9BACL|nr:amino acid permease [Sporolactobacillus spathodeae]MBM7658474.1 amino acid transporter [Sporolactobacillus spathodeae]